MGGGAVLIGDMLFDHHKGFDDEILSIIAHELGHWKDNHIAKIIVVNIFFVVVWCACMIPMIDRPELLNAFNIRMESSWMTIWFVFRLFENSVDPALMLLVNKI